MNFPKTPRYGKKINSEVHKTVKSKKKQKKQSKSSEFPKADGLLKYGKQKKIWFLFNPR